MQRVSGPNACLHQAHLRLVCLGVMVVTHTAASLCGPNCQRQNFFIHDFGGSHLGLAAPLLSEQQFLYRSYIVAHTLMAESRCEIVDSTLCIAKALEICNKSFSELK